MSVTMIPMSTEAVEPDPKRGPGITPEEQGSNVPLKWKPTAAEPVPVVRCVQIKSNGERCNRWSIRGHTKCYTHTGAGNFPNVQNYAEGVVEAARLRLVGSADLAVDVLEDVMEHGSSDGVRVKAATEVLDRSGIRGGFDLKVEQEEIRSPVEEITRRLDNLARRAEEGSHYTTSDDIVEGEIIEDGPPSGQTELELFPDDPEG